LKRFTVFALVGILGINFLVFPGYYELRARQLDALLTPVTDRPVRFLLAAFA